MSYWKQFKPTSCSVGLKAMEKDEALREIVANLVKAKSLEEELTNDAIHALLEREKLASTGVGMGVAIPHVKLRGLDKVVCSLAIHHQGLEWSAVDAAPAHIFFAVLRPERDNAHYNEKDHIEMMSWIAGLARSSDFRSFAMQAKKKTDLRDLLKEMSAV